MTESSYKEFKRKVETTQISKIWEKEGSLEEIYNEWNEKVIQIKLECEKKPRKKKTTKTIRKMMKLRRKLKKESKTMENDETRKLLIKRSQLIREHIMEEEMKQYVKTIEGTIQSLRKKGGGVQEQSFWEFKRKLQKETKKELYH